MHPGSFRVAASAGTNASSNFFSLPAFTLNVTRIANGFFSSFTFDFARPVKFTGIQVHDAFSPSFEGFAIVSDGADLDTDNNKSKTAALYGAVGLFHYVFRRQFLALSRNHQQPEKTGLNYRVWDFMFYASFGFVVTSSVAIASLSPQTV